MAFHSSSVDGLSWPKLTAGILLQRYKRFLADVQLDSGETVTAHCPNSGSMKGCCEPGRTAYLSQSDNPKRRLRYTWEMIRMPTSLVGVNTSIPNRLVEHSLLTDRIASLQGYPSIRREVRYGVSSRIDLLLERSNGKRCFVEVKNCTLVEEGIAYFPDAVTLRGQKHLLELIDQVQAGHRAVTFFLVQRMDARLFMPADHIDPKYGVLLRKALEAGVEILVYDVDINPQQICLRSSLPFEL
ncbi:MAG: DNA/RNA nuclease SfsA [Thermodesulfobacteriota bacterium]